MFDNGFAFSAANPQSPPLLTISVPVGLQFGRNTGAIRFLGTSGFRSSVLGLGLTVPPGRTLALVGGEMTLQGAFLGAPGGRIELGSVAPLSQVRLNPVDGGWTLGYEGSQGFQNIEMSRSFIDTSIRANDNFQLLSSDGDISFRASNLDIGRTSVVRASTFTALPGGDITIDVENLTLREGANVSTITFNRGKAGNITVNASQSVTLTGAINIGPFVSPTLLTTSTDFRSAQSTGDGGALTINTRRLLLQNGAGIHASSEGLGNAGSLTVNAAESVQLIGTSKDQAPSALMTRTTKSGQGGTLIVNTPVLLVQGGAGLGTESSGSGTAGNLTINATESVQVIGNAPAGGVFPSFVSSASVDRGDAGNLTINTRQLIVRDGGQVITGTFSGSQGNGGLLTVDASESVQLIGASADGKAASGLFSQTQGSGNAGDLRLNTPTLLIRDGAVISAATFSRGSGGIISLRADTVEATNGGRFRTTTASEGRAGDIILTVSDRVILDGRRSGLFANTNLDSKGQGGDIRIATRQLNVQNGAEIAVNSQGTGRAGNLDIAANSVRLDRGRLTAETGASSDGEGAIVTLRNLDLLLMRHGSQISARAFGDARGGNVTIEAANGFIVAVPDEDSDIVANAARGRGGNIEIEAQGIFGLEERRAISGNGTNDIDASSEFGVAGTVTLNTPDVDPSRGLATLPTNVVDPSQQIAQSCTPGGERTSRFVATGRGGLPLSPDEPLRGRAIVTPGWVTLDEEAQTSVRGRQARGDREIDAASSAPTEIVEADGWVLDGKGNVVLVAHSQITNPVSSSIAPASCLD
ncbi:MAG: hypothetical protein Fur006_54490 [Coleofasciculaceae cyanobacterium]